MEQDYIHAEYDSDGNEIFPGHPKYKGKVPGNAGTDLQDRYNMAKKAYVHRKSWGLINNGLRELDKL